MDLLNGLVATAVFPVVLNDDLRVIVIVTMG